MVKLLHLLLLSSNSSTSIFQVITVSNNRLPLWTSRTKTTLTEVSSPATVKLLSMVGTDIGKSSEYIVKFCGVPRNLSQFLMKSYSLKKLDEKRIKQFQQNGSLNQWWQRIIKSIPLETTFLNWLTCNIFRYLFHQKSLDSQVKRVLKIQ